MAEDIVLVDDDRVIQKMVGGFLERKGYRVRKASDGIEALQLVRERVPDLIITDVRMPELNGLELAYRLRGHHRTAGVPILMFSEMGEAPDALVGYAAGADDYLPKPFELAILEAKVQAMLRRAAGMTAKANRGKVILFAHAKGGVGTTSLAVNIAVLLASNASRPVGLLDLDVEFGDSAVYLNLHPNQTLADLKASPGAPVDEALFEGFVTESGSVRLVVGADSPERAELVTLPAIQLAIDRLSATCEYVLIDSPASFSERTLTALDTSDLICLVTSASLPSLKATQRCLDLFEKLGVDAGRVRLILNFSTTHVMDVDTAAGILGRKPDFVVQRSESLDRAANSGRPLVTSHPGDLLVADLMRLADWIAASVPATPQLTA
ncbi:MAG TPA: response regulator [Verrucomicrobiae bacterium]|jgi:pilus assembly protein CpaE|nr:response regulator [Verrucomicrobiae bacterium]